MTDMVPIDAVLKLVKVYEEHIDFLVDGVRAGVVYLGPGSLHEDFDGEATKLCEAMGLYWVDGGVLQIGRT